MTFKTTVRFTVSLTLVALAITFFAGCALKPGNSDSSAAPPSVLLGDSSNRYGSLFSTPITYPGDAVASSVQFSHYTHASRANVACSECHPGLFPMGSSTAVVTSTRIMAGVATKKITMAEMYAGKYCGKCHDGTKDVFDLRLSSNCVRCHSDLSRTDPHAKVDTTTIKVATCQACHAAIATEVITVQPSNLGAESPTGHVRSWIASHPSSACAECHVHESVTAGKAAALANNPTANHDISCQTCHYPNLETEKTAGTSFGKRLRKKGNDLCATCHHVRYTYNPAFPQLLADSTGKTALPVELNSSTFYSGDLTKLASTTNNAAVSTNLVAFARRYLGYTNNSFTGGNYPHDSPQYDLLMGKDNGGTNVNFTKDLNGATLVYGDTLTNRADANACVVCHMRRSETGSGHTFKPTPTADEKVKSEAFMKLLKSIESFLDADPKVAGVNWTRNGLEGTIQLDADLRKVLNAAGVPAWAKVVMVGAAWNYNFLEGDLSEGVHNPDFATSLASNTLGVLTQTKVRGLQEGWWTW